MLSRGSKAVLGATAVTSFIVWYVVTTEEEMRKRMKAGPQRDKVVYDAKLKAMTENKVAHQD